MKLQNRHTKPSECAGDAEGRVGILDNCVESEILFLSRFIKMQKLDFLIKYVISTQNSSLLVWEEGAAITNRISPKLSVCEEASLPSGFERLPLGSQKKGFCQVGTRSHLDTNT